MPFPRPPRMKDHAHRLVLAVALSSGLCVLFAFLNLWLCFGVTTSLLIALSLALGVGRDRGQRPVVVTIALIFLTYCGLIGGMAWLHDPAGEPRLVFGLPSGTAFLIYGIAPLGMLPSFLYPLAFDRWILPPERLDRFVAEFGRGKAGK